MYKVKIGDEVIYADGGEILSDVLLKHKKPVEHPCGGRGTCKKCKVNVNGKEELSCRYVINSDIEVSLSGTENIISETGADTTGSITKNLCFALDIGTTTIALALVSLDEGKIVKVITGTNPQRAFGADIMTRISYCRQNSQYELNRVVIAEINRLIGEFGIERIDTMYVAGNVTMLHLFFNVDCSSIGVAPYTPVFLESKSADAEDIGIIGVGKVISLPSVSSFVGADIVAGMNYTGFPSDGKYNLLVDLGTNAEVVLFSENSGLATAAAAGPCFEGANISFGMSATSGAVYSFSLKQNREKDVKTISDVPAKGICGTGLIDIIAELVKANIIDETGYMEDETYIISDNVTLSQGDVRQFQLAKSAVYSAILSLIKTENIAFEQIENMYISGGFSAKINIESAVTCGLLPAALASKTVPINNSSLLGTVKFALEQNDLSVYTRNTEYVDLSSSRYFSDLFIENMMFETL